MHQVNITKEALRNLRAIKEFYLQKNQKYALKISAELLKFCLETFSQFPDYGHSYNKKLGIRRAVHGDYNIYYFQHKNQIYILYIYHHKMHQNSLIRKQRDLKFEI